MPWTQNLDRYGCLKNLTMKEMDENGENEKFVQQRDNGEELWKKR